MPSRIDHNQAPVFLCAARYHVRNVSQRDIVGLFAGRPPYQDPDDCAGLSAVRLSAAVRVLPVWMLTSVPVHPPAGGRSVNTDWIDCGFQTSERLFVEQLSSLIIAGLG
ncbi:MAG: hypothetical protein AAF709_12430 [Pseudomonadota bacterium]